MTDIAGNKDQSVSAFVQENSTYYQAEFDKIQGKTGFTWSWNLMAALFGPLWGAIRGAWGFFWVFIVLELFALVQIGRGLWGELGAEQLVRHERLLGNIARREEQAAELLAAGDAAGAEAKLNIANNLRNAADRALEAANSADSAATMILLTGLALMLAVKLIEGFYANYAYEAQYLRWRAGEKAQSGLKRTSLFFGVVGLIAIWPLTLVRFTFAKPDEAVANVTGGLLGDRIPITEFPVGREYFALLSRKGDDGFDWLANNFGDVFDGVTASIRWLLDGLEVLLIQTPWPVVMFVTVVMALRLAGPRVAVFTAASLAYLAFMGLWELSMITIALIGAGAFLCVLFGIPLGIWFGKSKRAYAFAEPVLDFMQTMPAFVYLIPIIAFFGTGKPPGVLATLVFAMPPVIRLTALGMRGVPETTKEAAIAFGCSKRQLLFNVELPLALPSIMTGINQTILMSLSMVVIASLIGADGLGALILEALQYAAKGQGLLGGLAILFCAMVIDRIAQGMYRRKIGKE
ncbi:ABC transporter permease [Cochlodiniinecator piscidefendens]|uniref:ABC transporter permease n=1 Tax=Cochlodiniinecator piscidefendens TaxID=2715756 RepID=UPI00140B7226|nr:ABC transporter permease subunit [Cochlodiniinecator piscidefendens]